MYAIANVPTAIRDSLDFLKTDAIILTLFEYLNILNALKTLNALAILKILKSLKPLFKTDIDDIMSEQKYTIQNQENVEITLNIPKEILLSFITELIIMNNTKVIIGNQEFTKLDSLNIIP